MPLETQIDNKNQLLRPYNKCNFNIENDLMILNMDINSVSKE